MSIVAAWLHGGMEVGLGPGDIAVDGSQLPFPKKWGTAPLFSAPSLLWPNGWWIKMALGMEVGLGRGHIVLDGDPAHPPPRKGA